MQHTTLYVVTRQLPNGRDDYLFKHPTEDLLVTGDKLDNPNCYPPEHFEPVRAQNLARELNARADGGERWVLEIAPHPCPGCGREMWANDLDFCYSNNRERTAWRAGCNVHDFGCGFEVISPHPTYEEAIAKWNSANVFEYPNAGFARVEYLGKEGLEKALKDAFSANPQYWNTDVYPDGWMDLVREFAGNPASQRHYQAKHYLYLIGPKEA